MLSPPAILPAGSVQAQRSYPGHHGTATPPNTAAQQAKHYVILVSLDGFRYDYPRR